MLDNAWGEDVVRAFLFNDSWSTIVVSAREASAVPDQIRTSNFCHWRLVPESNTTSRAGKIAPDLDLLNRILKPPGCSLEGDQMVRYSSFC